MNISIDELQTICQTRIDNMFQIYLSAPKYPDPQLQAAVMYAVQNGGKRVRPLLVYAVGHSLGASWENLDAPACSIELIHAYSLIHDDLPAMDNSDFRRGKPSCHKKFGEATAILAGDALQPLALELLAKHDCALTSQQRLEMICDICQAAGISGMVAGQGLDLAGVDSIETLNRMYQLKTGALLSAAVKLGYLSSGVDNLSIYIGLENYIKNIGLAFQIQDDLLDVMGDEKIIGKPLGLDLANCKVTYPSLLGIEKTQATIDALFKSALQHIEIIGDKKSLLEQLAYFLMARKK